MRRPDHHNEIELNLIESGSLTFLLGGRKIVIGPGQLCVFWAAVPHQIIECRPATTYFVATIPLTHFLQWRLPHHLVHPLMQGQAITLTSESPPSADLARFALWEADLPARGPDIEKAVLLEMHARLVRLAAQVPTSDHHTEGSRPSPTLPEGGMNKIEQIACFIAKNYTEQLSVQQIADSVNLHPNYAMNLFHRTFGTTLIQYLTQHRISHAQRLLATTDRKVTDIALESGFNSISRFNAAFRTACRCTPREYRRSQSIGPSIAGPEPRRPKAGG